ncbi:MAG: glutamate racemase [Lachnospiraceae bacterium]|jgi:glutamate racemase|nr:glutamate racemase [Lachnospiraceae bacterium]
MSVEDAPIGVFDSGVGGLTVAREIMRQMPDENIVYFGDTARVPYGNKSKTTILRFSRQIVSFLRTKQVKAIVIACNTASAHALDIIEKEQDIPVIGVIRAGARTAAAATENGRIGIIATRGTIDSGVYEEVLRHIDPGFQIFGKACPLFVPLVEEGLTHDFITEEIARRYVKDLQYKGIDTMILGCTHYPLLRSLLKKVMGDDVTLVNPAYETAVELLELLEQKGMRRKRQPGGPPAEYRFYVSDLAAQFQEFAGSILPYDVAETQQIDIESYGQETERGEK